MTNEGTPGPRRIVGVMIRRDEGHPSLRNVRPILDRQPTNAWALQFIEYCNADDQITWDTGGFARCRQEDAYAIRQGLVRVAQAVNLVLGLGDELDTTTGTNRSPSSVNDETVDGYVFAGNDWQDTSD